MLGGQDHGIALFEHQLRIIASHVDFSTAELRLEIEELDQSVFVEKGNVPWEKIAYPGDARNDLKLLLPGMLLGASALQSSNLKQDNVINTVRKLGIFAGRKLRRKPKETHFFSN